MQMLECIFKVKSILKNKSQWSRTFEGPACFSWNLCAKLCTLSALNNESNCSNRAVRSKIVHPLLARMGLKKGLNKTNEWRKKATSKRLSHTSRFQEDLLRADRHLAGKRGKKNIFQGYFLILNNFWGIRFFLRLTGAQGHFSFSACLISMSLSNSRLPVTAQRRQHQRRNSG